MNQNTDKRQQDDISLSAEALAHAGLHGLIAALPVAVWIKSKEAEAIAQTLAKAGGPEVQRTIESGVRTLMRNPVIAGAVIVAAGMSHGAWHGYHKARRHKRHWREHLDRMERCEAELHAHRTGHSRSEPEALEVSR